MLKRLLTEAFINAFNIKSQGKHKSWEIKCKQFPRLFKSPFGTKAMCDISTSGIMTDHSLADINCPENTKSQKFKHRYRIYCVVEYISKGFIAEMTMDQLYSCVYSWLCCVRQCCVLQMPLCSWMSTSHVYAKEERRF